MYIYQFTSYFTLFFNIITWVVILDVSNYKPQDFVRIIQYNKNQIIDISKSHQQRDHKIEMI
jgi:hypothetical protein